MELYATPLYGKGTQHTLLGKLILWQHTCNVHVHCSALGICILPSPFIQLYCSI